MSAPPPETLGGGAVEQPLDGGDPRLAEVEVLERSRVKIGPAPSRRVFAEQPGQLLVGVGHRLLQDDVPIFHRLGPDVVPERVPPALQEVANDLEPPASPFRPVVLGYLVVECETEEIGPYRLICGGAGGVRLRLRRSR